MELQPVKKANQKSYQPAQSEQAGDTRGRTHSAGSEPKDRLALSKQALAFLEQQAAETQAEAERASHKSDNNRLNAGSGKSSLLDGLGKSLKTMKRCQEIARRIMAGDNVPPKDRQYLMANDAKGYQLAMAARRNNPDPKDWDSVVKEEENNRRNEVASGVEASPSPTVQPTSSPDHAFGEGDGS